MTAHHPCKRRMNTRLGSFNAVHRVGESATRPVTRLLVRLPLCPHGIGWIGKAAKRQSGDDSALAASCGSRTHCAVALRQTPDQTRPRAHPTAVSRLNADKPSSNFWMGNGILGGGHADAVLHGAAIERDGHPGKRAVDLAFRRGHGACDVGLAW